MTAIGDALVLSPDGRMLAIVARNAQGRPQLYVRPYVRAAGIALAGTEGAHAPFFSPDGQWIGFFAMGVLKKVAVTGGATVTLCPAVQGRGAAWAPDGTIFFQPNGAPGSMLQRVRDTGGAVVPFGKQTEGEITQRWPQVLPHSRGVLYSGNSGTTGWDHGRIMVQPLDGGSPKLLWRGGYHARYVPSGHLLYIHQATLFALPFDLDSLTVTGSAAPVIEGVLSTTTTGGAFYSVSDDGSLMYVPGTTIDSEAPIHLLEGAGKLTLLRPTAAEWYFPRFSPPDGRRLAVTIGAGSESDIWIHESDRDLTKFTFEPGADLAPVWTPLGDRLAFASSRPATRAHQPVLAAIHRDGTGGTIDGLAEPADPILVPSQWQVPRFH